MEVYDKARELAREIKSSKEYKEFEEYRNKVNSDSEMRKRIDDFEKLRYELQVLEIKIEQGKEKNDEELKQKAEKLQSMYSILVSNKDIKEYFDKEIAFNVMLADINKIIGEAVVDLMEDKK